MLLITGGAHHAHGLPLLLALIVLGFLGYKAWQQGKRVGNSQSFAANGSNGAPGAAAGGAPSSAPWGRAGVTTDNTAFEEWRAGELARLEAERRKLEDARREFAEFVESVRKAKDREEFERFMSARNPPQA